MAELLKLENISKYYTSGQSVVMGLHNVSLSFKAGEFVAVTGESGSGKSTLARVIAGILPYEGGEMTVDGKPTSHYGQPDWEIYRSSRISFISQSYDILPGCSVLKNVVSALVLTGMEQAVAAGKAEEILNQVELLEHRNRKAAKLSSGQKQRLSIARALAKPAPILIADEPTGNLDAENSEKVIELLQAAARERLVIMVTHDFDEAEDYVTRHITIREGAVDADRELRPVGETVRPENMKKDKPQALSFYTARLQISSRPVWSVVMLLFFALTAFAIFAFLGTFVVNLDDNFTRKYDNSAFRNGDNTRIVVMRRDREEMRETDWNILRGLEHVESLERFGLLNDISYYYREDTDYFYHYTPLYGPDGSPTGVVERTITLGDEELFLQTIPYGAEADSFLTAGRFPENLYEVVAAGDENLLGTALPVFISNCKDWAAGTYILIDVTVVGVTDVGEHLYFDDQLGRALTADAELGVVNAPVYQLDVPESEWGAKYKKGSVDSLEGRFICSEKMYTEIYNSVWKEGGINDPELIAKVFEREFLFRNFQDPDNPVALKLYGRHDSTYKYFVLVEPKVFEKIVPDGYGNEVSLTISDYAYMDRVRAAVHELGYSAVSPYQIGTTKQDAVLAAERLQTLKICILASLAVFLLQILVLRAMFGMEDEEFRLLANLGLRCRTAKRSIFWQIIVFAAGGQMLAAAVVFLCSCIRIERIVSILRYLPLPCILLFLLVHLVICLLTSLWIQAAVARQVYPSGLQYMDLKMDEVRAHGG